MGPYDPDGVASLCAPTLRDCAWPRQWPAVRSCGFTAARDRVSLSPGVTAHGWGGMRTSISFGGAGGTGEDWLDVVEYVREAERLGVDFAWSAEAWGQDAVSAVAYLAAVTSRIRLGTGIMQITARVPPMIAMTALSLDRMTGGRFVLGLGVSGPQVVEGMHGARFARPLARLRETLDIVEMGLRGERIAYRGRHFALPLPGGEGKAIALSMTPRPELPVYLATLGPRSLEFTGERAQGWLGTSFVPDRADVFFEPLARGAARAGRTLADLDIQVGGRLRITDDVDETVASLKPTMAFQLGAMGSATTNFYNDAYRRAGWEEAAREVQRLWLDRRREEAAAAVPDDLILRSNLIGTPAMVRERIRLYRDAGVTTLRLSPIGETVAERVDQIGQALDLASLG